jgi:predicted CoA-binding protein
MKESKKKTLVVGGSLKPQRFSHKAINMLTDYGHPVVSVGLREGDVAGVKIKTGKPNFENIHTITLYLGPQNQPEFYDYLLGLHPKRIIFNPGTENKEFEKKAEEKGIEVVNYCTLIMLGNGSY